MAAVVASKPIPGPTKMKKPSIPLVQTNANSTKSGQQPSASPSSATKRLPGQTPTATPVSATTNNASRQNRRLQRLSTRTGTMDNVAVDRKSLKKYPEPYVPKASHILKKYKGRPPSLIIHLHPTHFRFDQQEGSFAYNSEMRIFIEHLHKGTIPHDMIEEFRKTEVQFYDGWIIVRVIDHRNTNNSAGSSGGAEDDGKVFSIHNYNPYITPSPYAPYPTKEQTGQRSPRVKQENKDSNSSQSKEGQNGDARSDDTVEAAPRSTKPQSKVYHVALRPTTLSRHMDLVIDAMAPDPKTLNRKQSQANVARTPGAGAPPTPVSGVPSTPATDKGPPPKRQKMKIDAKDLLDYEARTVNATAPPIYLDVVQCLDEAEAVISMLRDPYHNEPPPSLKSRKRTVAELAAEDAHAKEQERFMLVMDERNAGTSTGANAGAMDAQAGAALFQPRFEKFNALETIKRDFAERKQREKDRQLQEDENRRQMQERAAEDTERRRQAERQRVFKQQQAMRQQQVEAAMQQQQQNHQQPPGMQQQMPGQASGIPPQMAQRMAAQQQRSSPIMRQGTPHAASSPIVNGQQGGQAMTVSGSQQGAGSPARPGSAVQHGHPMARGPSGQGPSRNGTPQIPHSTPGMRTATPVVRQGTPAQHMTQASPHGSMMAPTPQMPQAAAMQNQMANGMHPHMTQQQQMAELQRRQQMQQQAQLRQQQMANGTTPQMGQAQMAHMQAQHHAQQQAAMQRAHQQQQAQQQAMQQQQQGTPQSVAQSPANNQASYNKGVAESMKAQMQALQQGQTQGSPAPNSMTPANQSAQLAHQHQQRMMQQAQQQNQMMAMQNPQQQPQQGQPQMRMTPQMQQLFNNHVNGWTSRLMTQHAAKYGGNTAMLNQQELQQIQAQARGHAMNDMKKRQMAQQAQLRQQQQQAQGQAAQQGGGGNAGGAGNGAMPNGMNMAQMNPNMQQALQQQQAHQMQQMQMQQAQQMMQHQHQQNGMAGNSQGGMASMQQYQHQLQQMAAQQQAQQQRQG